MHNAWSKVTFFLGFLSLFVASNIGFAQQTPDSLFNDSPKYLKVDEAFGFDFEQRGDQLIIKWDIADGYYLYKKQFKTSTKNATLGAATYPQHEQIEDEFFGLSDVFFVDMEMSYPIIRAKQDSSVKIRFQGCAKAGLCYPPTTKVVFLSEFDSGLPTPEEVFSANIEKIQDNIVVTVASDIGFQFNQNAFVIDAFFRELGAPNITNNGQQTTLSYPILSTENDILANGADDTVEFSYQGCADSGLCYQTTTIKQNLSASNSASSANPSLANNSQSDTSSAVSSQFTLAEKLLSDQSVFISLGLLALLGLGLAFTPCVYPMYPILSSIVIGKGKKDIKASHAFTLSFVYVQGMAITYSILGLIVASAGVQFQAALQHPILLGVFIILFVALALAMFGLYEIQMPAKWQEKLNGLSGEQKQGNYWGVFIMGVVSGLVASPCTTAPLTAVLIVVAQSDSLIFGFSALYALSIGMGIPLILFGVTGGKLLPKAGSWMNVIKVTFGFMMLTVAILFVERFIIADWTDLLWAALGLGLFTYWYTVNQATQTTFMKGVRTLIAASGLMISILFTIVALQKMNWIPTLLGTTSNNLAHEQGHPEFMVVRDLTDFEQKLADANASGKTVMLDLYATWCKACEEFEKYTFPDPQVVDALSEVVWMQIDLTENTPSNLEFQEKFNIIGLPTIMFFNLNGQELERARVTGFMKAEPFATHAKNTLPKSN
ncbi:protein-disulfide reductase DsbD [Glaciecola petra]|uniref:Thiol:disulfide interchange protein DsbD n=1 Tax=Glaciecola petra TaxID=3075602 RepID=A0ABU2ZUG8_9ALTE|nr:protein-disulfide reductase DsbD [Aestuariibacter sp. P117]MDT0595234.1 protein-disulfide reductase DsbD [Aestuariibacter sp. P117]